jgi:hypothetical protein
VCLYKKVYKNFTGVLGFSHFSIINVAHLDGLWRWEKTKDYSGTVVGCGVWMRHMQVAIILRQR